MCAFDTAWFNYFLIVEHGQIWVSQVVLVVKNMPANAEDTREAGSIPRWRRFPGEGNGNPLQYSCLENSTDRGAWWALVHGLTKSWTWLSDYHFRFHTVTCLTQEHFFIGFLFLKLENGVWKSNSVCYMHSLLLVSLILGPLSKQSQKNLCMWKHAHICII